MLDRILEIRNEFPAELDLASRDKCSIINAQKGLYHIKIQCYICFAFRTSLFVPVCQGVGESVNSAHPDAARMY